MPLPEAFYYNTIYLFSDIFLTTSNKGTFPAFAAVWIDLDPLSVLGGHVPAAQRFQVHGLIYFMIYGCVSKLQVREATKKVI